MTFHDIAVKNFKGNLNRYLSYFLCNSFAVMFFFLYSTIMFNEFIMHSPQVEKGVTAVVILPNVAIAVFSIFFICYTHASFLKARKREFGVFMNLGMSLRDIQRIILIENAVIAMAVIFTGLLSGTVFSRLFHLVIMALMNITGIPYTLTGKSYWVTVAVFCGIFAGSILYTLVVTRSLTISELLKGDRLSEENKKSSPIAAIAGIGTVVISMIVLYTKFGTRPDDDGFLFLSATILCLIGLYVAISQMGGVLLQLCKRRDKVYCSHMLLLTNIRYKFWQTKNMIFTISILVMIIIWYGGHTLNLFFSSERMSYVQHPYDITYVQTPTKNNLPAQELNAVIQMKDNPLSKHKSLPFIHLFTLQRGLDRRFIILSTKEFNEITGQDISVGKGTYRRLELINYEPSEGKGSPFRDEIKLALGNDRLLLAEGEPFYQVAFNQLNYFRAAALILVQGEDYQTIRGSMQDAETGYIHVMNFVDWKKTKGITRALNEAFSQYNSQTAEIDVYSYFRGANSEDSYFLVSSRYEAYNYTRQTGELIFYLLTLVGLFFFSATCVLLFLKLYSEIEYDKKVYKRLYKIGVTNREIRRNIAGELKVVFFAGPVIGLVLAYIYSSVLYKDTGAFKDIYMSNGIIGATFMLLQLVYYLLSKKKYTDDIIESLK